MPMPSWTKPAVSLCAPLSWALVILTMTALGCAQKPSPPPAGEGAPPQAGPAPAAGARVFQPVQRGDVKPLVVERGQVEPAHAADLVCKVRGRGPNKAAPTIRWVIDDGSLVKKGDRLLELDDPALREELTGQEAVRADRQALLVQAESALKVAEAGGDGEAESGQAAVKAAEADLKKLRAAEERDRRKLEIRLQQARQTLEILKLQNTVVTEEAKLIFKRAEGDIEIAEIELKGHAEAVLADRQKLEAQLQQAQSALAAAKARAAGAKDHAKARVAAARAALDAETARLAELKEDVARSLLVAPTDGIVLHVTPEPGRFGAAASAVAVGESVRDGQRLLRVADLSKLQVKVRVHESQVARLRAAKDGDDRARGQPAQVRIDAYPDRTLAGHLRSLAAVADTRDWMAADVKVYPGVVALDEAPAGLKPGMTAEVTFALDERKGVLRVPVQAVLAEGRERFCYVKAGDGVEKRKLATGLSDQRYMEVKEGLKEGEEVLVNPQAERPAREGRGPAGGPKQSRGPGATDIIVRSVRPPADAAGARSFVLTYGLTLRDYEAFQAIESVTRAVPVRSFPQEARRQDRVSRARLVATVAEYAEVHLLELAKGRFLTAEDDRQSDNVAVLGPAAARELFPLDDPLGQTVQLGQHFYKVVGVVAEGPAVVAAGDVEHDVYIPLRTCRARFGDNVMIRTAGARTVEAVELSQVILSVRSPEQIAPTADLVTGQLRKSHDRKDWDVLTPGAP